DGITDIGQAGLIQVNDQRFITNVDSQRAAAQYVRGVIDLGQGNLAGLCQVEDLYVVVAGYCLGICVDADNIRCAGGCAALFKQGGVVQLAESVLKGGQGALELAQC